MVNLASAVSGLTVKRGAGGTLGEIFISHASADAALAAEVGESVRQAGHVIFLDTDLDSGIAPGADWQLTLFRELRACDAVVFLNSKAAQASKWCHSELVVATERGKRIYSLDLDPDLPPHPLLLPVQGIRFDSDIGNGIRRLTDSLILDGLAGNARPRWRRSRAPYPGLAALDVGDAGVFFGREGETRDLLARVDGPLAQSDGDVVIVMGPSGAGKSSLVRAGLVARLAVPRSGWLVADPFEPGIRPLGRHRLSWLADQIWRVRAHRGDPAFLPGCRDGSWQVHGSSRRESGWSTWPGRGQLARCGSADPAACSGRGHWRRRPR